MSFFKKFYPDSKQRRHHNYNSAKYDLERPGEKVLFVFFNSNTKFSVFENVLNLKRHETVLTYDKSANFSSESVSSRTVTDPEVDHAPIFQKIKV